MSLYSPWTERSEEIAARTVGRTAELDALRAGAQQIAAGARPLPLYLFGPRGVGKSHLVLQGLADARSGLEDQGFPILNLREDVPRCTDADELWKRMAGSGGPRWFAWERDERSGPDHAVVVVEGLDRQLRSLGQEGRRRLRAHLDAHPDVWLVATGARLTDELVNVDEAFYGWFRTIPIGALDASEAAALLDKEVGAEVLADARWPARREAIVVLSGGNPRALLALARAVRGAPGDEVAGRLLVVLDDFTPHYQLRFQDLNPQEQQLVELLAMSPRELGPTEVSQRLGGLPASWSTCAHRLEDHGLLRIRREGRNAWYRIPEPLFRYWLEFRSASWEETRVAWLGQLLELVLGPSELVETWSRAVDATLKDAALRTLRQKPAARGLAWDDRARAVLAAVEAEDGEAIARRVGEAAQVGPTAPEAWSMVVALAKTPYRSAAAALADGLRHGGCPTLARLAAARGGDARKVLGELLQHGVDELRRAGVGQGPLDSYGVVVVLLDDAIQRTDPRGGVWKLTRPERRRLAEFPMLRGRFARQGRRSGHPALLSEGDLLEARLSTQQPDLADLLWVTEARGMNTASARILGLLAGVDRPRLPWCPWPGRPLALDPDVLALVMSREPTLAALSWLGSVVRASDPRFDGLVEAIGARPPNAPQRTRFRSFELPLAAIGLENPARLEALRSALGDRWAEVIGRADLLVRQLAEGQRGPLHDELSRIRDAMRARPPVGA